LLDLFIPSKSNNYKPHLLNNIALVIYTLILFVTNVLGNTILASDVLASSITTKNIIELTNVERAKYGYAPLSGNNALNTAAMMKANNMFKEQYWDHFGPNGETPWQFIKASGYSYVYAGENLAKGFKTSEGVVQAWMASPTHKDNVLSPNYNEIGVAVVSGNLKGENVILVVQMFGNLTKNTVQPVKVETVNKDIKLKITSPKQGDILNNAVFDIKGTIDSTSDYDLKIIDNGKDVGNVKGSSKDWTYDKQSDWTEGEHKVEAKINSNATSVSFSVDTTAPSIMDNSLSVTKVDDRYKISVLFDDLETEASIVSGINGLPLTLIDGYYTVEVMASQIEGDVILMLNDKVGNSKEVNISEYFNEKTTDNTGWVLGLGTLGIQDGINRFLVGFIFVLLLVEVIYLIRLRRLKSNGNSLFTIGMWWGLLAFGVFYGYSGIIS